MRVIICGAGRVGQGIARHLSQEHHDIIMIDENHALIEQVQIDFDVRGVVGPAAHPAGRRSDPCGSRSPARAAAPPRAN